MPLISVKTKPGRVAYTAPKGGERISNVSFVAVEKTPWIVRLIEHHGDLEVESAKAPAAKPDSKPAPAPVADKPTSDKG